MPTASPMTLAGYALPDPFEYDEEIVYRGGMSEMAGGGVAIDLVADTPKRRWRMAFRDVDHAQKLDLQSAWNAVRKQPVAFSDVVGDLYQVTRDPEAPDLRLAHYVLGNRQLRYRVEIRLWEE